MYTPTACGRSSRTSSASPGCGPSQLSVTRRNAEVCSRLMSGELVDRPRDVRQLAAGGDWHLAYLGRPAGRGGRRWRRSSLSALAEIELQKRTGIARGYGASGHAVAAGGRARARRTAPTAAAGAVIAVDLAERQRRVALAAAERRAGDEEVPERERCTSSGRGQRRAHRLAAPISSA